MSNIDYINIVFENGENVVLNREEFVDFYISNLNNKGEEIPYEQTIIKNKLYANLCLIKINNRVTDYNKMNRIKSKNDIAEIQIVFNNQLIKFDIASNADPFDTIYNNTYQYIYEDENSLGILLSEHNIKYKESLFV